MLISRASVGLRLNRLDPQSAQKSFSKPRSGANARTRCSPSVTRRRSPSTRTCTEAAVPVRRLQRVQWQ